MDFSIFTVIVDALIECLVCPRHCSKGFLNIISIISSLRPMRKDLHYPHFMDEDIEVPTC